MNIESRIQGAVTILRPVGPLIQDDAAQFRSRAALIAKESLGRLVVDTSAIPYTDSAGLEAFVDLTHDLTKGGRALKIAHLNPTIREVLELTDLANSFEIFDDVNTAVRSFL